MPIVPLNIFVPNQTLEFEAEKFNHCSTICPYRDGVIIAWYSGMMECSDDQSVYLLFIGKDTTSRPLKLKDGTGNPVIWQENGKTYLLWSRFEHNNKIAKLTDLWKYCSLWMTEIDLVGDELQLIGEIVSFKEPHLLGRCRPIQFADKIILPLYDEVNQCGIIMAGTALDFVQIGQIGNKMIQPTLWIENDKICSLSRNFHSEHKHARYSESIDGGKTWSEPILTNIKNKNSSLHAITWNGHHLLLWNNTCETRRKDLTLGIIKNNNVHEICKISEYGAYPSICKDSDDNLCMSFTSNIGVIRYYVWNKNDIISAISE